MKGLIPVLLTVSLAGCAAPQCGETARLSPHGRECFNVSMISGYSSLDRDTVRLDAGPARSYEVDISGPSCDRIDWSQRIVNESRPSSWICVGDTAGLGMIFFRDFATRRRLSCHIDAVRAAPEEGQG